MVARRIANAEADGRSSPKRLGWARDALARLEEKPPPAVLVHGDFDERNILRCARRGICAIDPLVAAGDPLYDAAYWIHGTGRPGHRARFNALSDALDLDRDERARLRDWCGVIAVHGLRYAPTSWRRRAEAGGSAQSPGPLESGAWLIPDSFGARSTLEVGGRELEVSGRRAPGPLRRSAAAVHPARAARDVLRREDGVTVTANDVEAVAGWNATAEPSQEINYNPARVLLQDFTGVPAVVDLAAMRAAMADLGGDPQKINPLIPVELVIDHSVQVDDFATRFSIERNSALEFSRNRERYAFLRWGQGAFANFKAVPPNTGICHQVNLEFLARVVEERDGQAYPDTVVGTDSHTTMVNGLGVLGWGVGGIEAEAAMLGEAISMLVPQVVGFRLHGALPEGATATDLVLTVTQILRQTGVVGKFVEYFGHGLVGLPLADRATIGNMSPEYGATCGFFPVDDETLRYLRLTGRSDGQGRARRGLLQGERALARPRGAADVLAGRRARPLHRRAVDRRATAPAGSDPAARCAQCLLGGAAVLRGCRGQRRRRRGGRGVDGRK